MHIVKEEDGLQNYMVGWISRVSAIDLVDQIHKRLCSLVVEETDESSRSRRI